MTATDLLLGIFQAWRIISIAGLGIDGWRGPGHEVVELLNEWRCGEG